MKKIFFVTICLILVSVPLFLLTTTTVQAACTRTVTNTNDSGAGSLRQAILDSNVSSDLDEICFNIAGGGVKTISPTSALPAITRPTILDGTTQTGFSSSLLIELNGTSAGASVPGIWVTGGSTTIKGLIINRFSGNGIILTDNGGNTIVRNQIGTDSVGTLDYGNGGDGLGIFNSPNNTVGGSSSTDRNIISGNGGNGLGITGGSASGNVVKGNYIGTTIFGTAAIPNTGDGLLINDSPNNTVGGMTGTTPDGSCTGDCNLISGNIVNGIGIWHSLATGNTVYGNFVGVNVSGTGNLANGDIGLEINEAANNTVGGSTPEARNIFSGNLGAGVFVTGAGATGNTVQGNYIGTNTYGNLAMPNIKMGVGIGNSPGIGFAHHNTIGGTAATTPGGSCTGACNLISGNVQNGILITGAGGSNQILGNTIGLNVAGTGNLANGLDGIGINGSPNNLIGNGSASARNVISGNLDNGIIIVGGASTGNRIDSNYIGIGTDGSDNGNRGAGVMVADGVDSAILGNSIYSNNKLGIDLNYNNVTLNDNRDGDGGPNRSQNFPVVFAETAGNVTRIYGTLNSTPNTSFRIDFFSSPFCNAGPPLNFGEGKSFLSNTTVSTDVFGNVSFAFTSPSAVAGGQFITTTASKLLGSTPAETSEFSECSQVNASRPGVFSGSYWFLRNSLISGVADSTFIYGFPAKVLMCAWDTGKPGVKLPVVFSDGSWFFKDNLTDGVANLSFGYGSPGDRPVCGDWDGDGIDSIGVVSGANVWALRNSNSGGPAEIVFQYGPYWSIPVVGDWDGNGTDTIGVVIPGNGWSLRNAVSGGPEQIAFQYGSPGTTPVVGDWNGDGIDSIGVVSSGNTWFLRNFSSSGPVNISFQYGFPGSQPVVWK